MSTRLRVVLKYPNGEQLRGPIAVATLCHLLRSADNSRKFVLRAFIGSKRQRLEALAKQLPKGYALILVQEPRRTRRNRSFCWGKVAMPAAQPAPDIQFQEMPAVPQDVLAEAAARQQIQAAMAAQQQPQVAYRWAVAPVPPFRPQRRRNPER